MVHDVSQAEHERVQKGENLLSIVTPAYNEVRNLPVLYERLGQALAGLNVAWEWIVVDDHSGDDTFAVVASIAQCDSRVRAIRLARNLGSHTAIACGLHHAAGDCAVILAADLQDPPETLPALLDRWRAGAQGVWAVGARREGEGRQHRGLCPPGSLDAGRRRAADEHYLYCARSWTALLGHSRMLWAGIQPPRRHAANSQPGCPPRAFGHDRPALRGPSFPRRRESSSLHWLPDKGIRA